LSLLQRKLKQKIDIKMRLLNYMFCTIAAVEIKVLLLLVSGHIVQPVEVIRVGRVICILTTPRVPGDVRDLCPVEVGILEFLFFFLGECGQSSSIEWPAVKGIPPPLAVGLLSSEHGGLNSSNDPLLFSRLKILIAGVLLWVDLQGDQLRLSTDLSGRARG